MDKQRRKELQEQFKQIKTYMGVVKITNTINGKILILTFPNLKNRWLTLRSQLDVGRYANSQLQKDWKEFGADAFNYEVIEEEEADDVSDVRWELEKMEKAWLEKLQPFGDRGYNKPLDRIK